MDKLKQSALAFKKLLKYEYEITAGSKKTLLEMTLFFAKEHYMHLIGLHKLTDLQMQRYKKDKMYDMVIRDELTYEYIEKSVFFPEIKERIELLPILEEALDRAGCRKRRILCQDRSPNNSLPPFIPDCPMRTSFPGNPIP